MPPSESGADGERAHGASPVARGRFGRFLVQLSELLALIGGALLLLIMAMTVISIIGRQLFGMPVKGDFEITELACGIAVFLFFPYTQITGQNIVAEFFTAGLSERRRAGLESVHDLVFAAVALFLAWRAFEGFLDMVASTQKTMLLGLPVWWAYVAAFGSCVVLTLVCLWCAARVRFGGRA
jgi:TRAP-type C4-dicarboxylate transport system permease small subunit